MIRINTNSSWKRSNWYDLWRVRNQFEKIEIITWNNELIINFNNNIMVNKDISYWSENKNYFKVWIYDSKNSKWPWNVNLLFSKLYID